MKHTRLAILLMFATLTVALSILSSAVHAQGPTGTKVKAARVAGGTPFTYQGQLKNASGPVNGTCNLQFDLWDAASGGTHVAGPANGTPNPVNVVSGLFTVQVDFGAGVFDGAVRFIEIAAKCGTESVYTSLAPRQQVTATPYAWNADTLDGQHASDFVYSAGPGLELAANQFKVKGSGYANMLVVAKSGGNFSTITAALNSITDADPAKHYLVYVAPGVYTETVTMKEYVDIEGAGELATKVTKAGSDDHFTATVLGANNAELRFLTVENTGGYTMAKAILNNHASPRLTNVTAAAWGGSSMNLAVQNYDSSATVMTNVTAKAVAATDNRAVYNEGSDPTLTNVSAIASGGTKNMAVFNSFSSATINNSTLAANGASGSSYGIYNYSTSSSPTYTVTVNSSRITGATNAIYGNPGYTTRFGASQLAGGGPHWGGVITCAGVYDENYTFYASTCP